MDKKPMRDNEQKWRGSFSKVLCLAGVIGIIPLFVFLGTRQELSSSDVISINLLILIISAGISFYLGRYFSYDEALGRIHGEAVKALRRIVGIKASLSGLKRNCDRITGAIMSDYKDKDDQKVLLEYLHGINSQVLDTLVNVNSSIDDWRDVIPKEVDGLRKAQGDRLKLLEEKQKGYDKLSEEYKIKIKEAGEEQKVQIQEEFGRKIEALKTDFNTRIAAIRSEVSPSVSPFDYSASPSVYGETATIVSRFGDKGIFHVDGLDADFLRQVTLIKDSEVALAAEEVDLETIDQTVPEEPKQETEPGEDEQT